MRLSQKFGLSLFIAGLIVAGILVYVVFSQARRQALNMTEIGAHAIADRNMAASIFYKSEIRPKVMAVLGPKAAEGYFDPALMSGTYINRNAEQIYRYISSANFQLKRFAINARTPESEASAEERRFISELNTNADLVFRTYKREADGEPHLVLMHRGLVQKESCLDCHGKPEEAPSGLIAIYGSERGFNRRVGKIVSGLSVTIPLTPFYKEADRHALELSSMLIALLVALLSFIYWLSRRMIFIPLQAEKVHRPLSK